MPMLGAEWVEGAALHGPRCGQCPCGTPLPPPEAPVQPQPQPATPCYAVRRAGGRGWRVIWGVAGPRGVAGAPTADGAPWCAPPVPWTRASTAHETTPPKPSSRENVGQPGSRGDTCAEGDVLPAPAGPGQPAGRSAKHDTHHPQTRGRVALLPPQRRYSRGNYSAGQESLGYTP